MNTGQNGFPINGQSNGFQGAADSRRGHRRPSEASAIHKFAPPSNERRLPGSLGSGMVGLIVSMLGLAQSADAEVDLPTPEKAIRGDSICNLAALLCRRLRRAKSAYADVIAGYLRDSKAPIDQLPPEAQAAFMIVLEDVMQWVRTTRTPMSDGLRAAIISDVKVLQQSMGVHPDDRIVSTEIVIVLQGVKRDVEGLRGAILRQLAQIVSTKLLRHGRHYGARVTFNQSGEASFVNRDGSVGHAKVNGVKLRAPRP